MNRKILFIVFGVMAFCLIFAACWVEFTINGHDPYKSNSGALISGKDTGTGEGYSKSTITVEVTLTNGLITAVNISSSTGELAPNGPEAISAAANIIILQNSFDLDTLSSATFTTNGIKEAGKQALTKLGATFDY